MEPLERGGLRARLAQGAADRARLLAMRQAAFPHRDGTPEAWEALDDACRHVLVETADGTALASFRALALAGGAALHGSYAARFYDLSPLAAWPRPVIEMGRFCLVPGPRSHEVLRLAWGAMTRIVDAAGAGLVIGCASFCGADWRRHRAALAHLAAHHLGPAALRPRERAPGPLRYPALAGPAGAPGEALAALPPLLRFYLALGGWVSDHAVADAELGTLHVFTCLEVARVPAARAASLRAIAGN